MSGNILATSYMIYCEVIHAEFDANKVFKYVHSDFGSHIGLQKQSKL